jgi:RNA polymerase sigma-70 factor (ECF subfamily)
MTTSSAPHGDSSHGTADAAGFAATRWSVVLAAAQGKRTPAAATAMEELCRAYWYPLYAFIRRRGYESHEAEDLAQGFFARLLEKRALQDVDPQKGKFRAFLLAALKHFLANERDRAQAQKRGGAHTLLQLDSLDGETRYRLEPAHDATPEKLFERQWALTVLHQVLARLQAEAEADGKAATFASLKGFLVGDRSQTHAAAGAALGLSEGAVKVAVHRLRRRYRELLREEIAHTVADPADVDEEIQYLRRCL